MWSSYIQAEIFLRDPEEFSLPVNDKQQAQKIPSYVSDRLTIGNAGYNVVKQVHIDIDHNFLQEIYTI
jgi:hypothetical protein